MDVITCHIHPKLRKIRIIDSILYIALAGDMTVSLLEPFANHIWIQVKNLYLILQQSIQ